MDKVQASAKPAEFKTIIAILAKFNPPAVSTVLNMAALIDTHLLPALSTIVMEYRGIETRDIPQLRPTTDFYELRECDEYAKFIFDRDMGDHIALFLDVFTWHDTVFEHGYMLSPETIADIGRPTAQMMVASYMAFGRAEPLTLENVRHLIIAMGDDWPMFAEMEDFDGIRETKLRRLIVFANYLRDTRGAVPVPVQTCLNQYIARYPSHP